MNKFTTANDDAVKSPIYGLYAYHMMLTEEKTNIDVVFKNFTELLSPINEESRQQLHKLALENDYNALAGVIERTNNIIDQHKKVKSK